MTLINQHIIQRQRIEVDVPRHLHTPALQRQFQHLLEERLMERLEPVFDRMAGPEVWLEIDQLEVDLGILSLKDDAQSWLDKAYHVFVDQLEAGIQKVDAQERSMSEAEVVAHFLEHGYLPWWVQGVSVSATIRKLIQERPQKLLLLLNSSRVRQRWVRQFDEDIQHLLAKRLKLSIPVDVQTWQALFPEVTKRAVRYAYWEHVWEVAREGKGLGAAWFEKLVGRTLPMLPKGMGKPQLRLRIEKAPRLPQTVRAQLLDALRIFPEESSGQAPKESMPPPQTPEPQAQEGGKHGNKHGDISLDLTAMSSLVPEEALSAFRAAQSQEGFFAPSSHVPQGGIYVPLAGTVLVHAFLPTLFERLGFLTDENFIHESAQERAVHVLYFLATDQHYPEEAETVLLKLLCGMDINQPIAREIDLTSEEKEEATHLLQALIRRWGEAMEGTTPEEIRGSFLVREGKLQPGDLGWQLTVEEQVWDVLLNKLPWGISPIQHSWMKEMIWVNWGY